MTELSLVASSGKVASPSPWRSPLGGRQSAPQHPLFTRLGLCRRCAGRRASLAAACAGTTQTHRGAGRAARASQKRGTWAWSQRGRRCQPGKAEARRVPQRKQVMGSGAPRETQGARPPPGAPRPFRLPLHGPCGLRPASGTLLPSPWGWLLLKDLGPTAAGHTYLLPPERRAQRLALSVDPVPAALTAGALLQAPAPAGGARCGARGLPGARLGGAESLDSTSLQTCHTVPRLRWGCGGSRGALFLF